MDVCAKCAADWPQYPRESEKRKGGEFMRYSLRTSATGSLIEHSDDESYRCGFFSVCDEVVNFISSHRGLAVRSCCELKHTSQFCVVS